MDRRTGALFSGAPGVVSGPGLARRRIAALPRGMAFLAVAALVFAACSSSVATGTPAPGGAPTPTATSSVLGIAQGPITSPEPSLATGAPTSIDPCQLVTVTEASQLAGVTYTAGEESTTSGGGKMCTYGGGTADVFEVIVGQAPDAATAQAGLAQAEADLASQANDAAKFTQLPGFADAAAYFTGTLTAGALTINAAALYALKGLVFFGFSLLSNHHAPLSLSALQAQGTTILGRLP